MDTGHVFFIGAIGDRAYESVEDLTRICHWLCFFCGERLGEGWMKDSIHICRHLEEIAFAVVRKPYEEWDFYSDSTDPINNIAT